MSKKVDDGLNVVNFECSVKKEIPTENKELEEDFKIFLLGIILQVLIFSSLREDKIFLAKGISNLVVKGEYFIA